MCWYKKKIILNFYFTDAENPYDIPQGENHAYYEELLHEKPETFFNQKVDNEDTEIHENCL